MHDGININHQRKIIIIYLVLTAVTLLVFGQVRSFDFVNFDDQIYVTGNFRIQSLSWNEIRWAFTNVGDSGFWHPLTWLSLMLDYRFFGPHAGGYHMTNLVFHLLSVLLLFGLFNRMTKKIWASAFVAAFFALHPLRVESVAWVAERKDVLSAFFWMLTLYLYVGYTEKPSIKRYLGVLLSFICGFMSKPIVVTLPVIMMLLDYWPLRRFQERKGNQILWQVREKIVFFFFSAIFSLITIYAQLGLTLKTWPHSFEARIINALVSFTAYLEKTFWPRDLAVCYSFVGQAPAWQILASLGLIAAVTAAVVFTMKRYPHLFVGWFWYLISILPVIGIVPIANDAMADRYVYLPSIGIAIMLAWGIPLLFKENGIRQKILFPVGVTFLVILVLLTWRQCGYWKNSTSLFSHALEVTKEKAIVHNNLAFALTVEGKMKEAIDHYDEALRIAPGNTLAYTNRGNVYAKLGRYQKAIADYNEAIRLEPDYAPAYYNRCNIYNSVGQYQSAIEDCSRAIDLFPYITIAHIKTGIAYDAYLNRGIAYARRGQYQNAIADFSNAVRLRSNDAGAYFNRGIVYLNGHNNKSGCSDAAKACELGNCQLMAWAKDKGLCP